MENEFYVIRFSHKGKNGFFSPQENVVHVHGNGFHNTRCRLVDKQFYCPLCNQFFDQQAVYASAKERSVGKDRSHWIETKVIGQHQEKVLYSHDHADKGVKAAEIADTKLFATCLSCAGTLDLFSWRETNTTNNQKPFAAVFVEQERMSLWGEISEFLAEKVDVWLEDKNGQSFYLAPDGKLLPTEKEEEMLLCGAKRWEENDTRKSLLFLVDEELTQELINRQLLKEEDQSFNLVMPEEIQPAEAETPPENEAGPIEKKPEPRQDRITKQISTGDFATVVPVPTPPSEASTESLLDDDTGLIPRASAEDLASATPLPESPSPLIETSDEPIITINHQEEVVSGSSQTIDEDGQDEAPKIVQIMPPPKELLVNVKPLTDTLNGEETEAETYDPLMADGDFAW